MGVVETNDMDREQSVDAFYRSYEPKEVLGRGVSSVVRRCTHRATKQDWAVKIIDLNSGGANQECTPEELHNMAMKEIAVLRLVHSHENIMQLGGVFGTDAHIFIVTELCPGGELFDFHTRQVTLSERRTRLIMRQLLSALEYIHSNFIVHRDVKLENVLLVDDCASKIRLCDFGFAVQVSNDTELTEGMGTLGYLAPEILLYVNNQSDEGYGRPVDLWAAGVVMFSLLSGGPPFHQRRRMFQTIRDGRYSFDAPVWDEVGDSAKDLITHLMDTDPQRRFTSTQALGHEFFHCADLLIVPSGVITKPTEKSVSTRARYNWLRAGHAVRALVHLDLLRRNPRPLEYTTVCEQPYGERRLRRLIDNAAFHIYNHWVKKGEEQNRAALFQNAAPTIRGNKGDADFDED